jgi:dsDNA-specific endonuclease/ATPase MutS2
LENLSDGEDINRIWKNIKENIKTSAKDSLGLHELKQHKPWFDEERCYFLGKRKQAKVQRVQDPYQRNLDNLNNVRREASRYYKKKEGISESNLKLTVGSKILGTCIGALVTL